MNRHTIRSIILALAVACFLPAASGADPADTPAATADTSTASQPTALATARAAYQTVWALRESGEYAIAVAWFDSRRRKSCRPDRASQLATVDSAVQHPSAATVRPSGLK